MELAFTGQLRVILIAVNSAPSLPFQANFSPLLTFIAFRRKYNL